MDNVKFYVSWLGVFAAGWEHSCVDKRGEFYWVKWETFCQQAANLGAVGVRIFPYETKWLDATKPWEMWSPNVWDDVQKAWNLDLYNPKYFSTIAEMIRIAAKYNIRIMYSLFDNCQRHIIRDRITALAPWLNNVQGIPLYMNDIPASLKWADKVYAEFGNTIDYEVGNEIEPAKKQSSMDAAEWLGAVWMRLIDLGVPAGNIIWGARPTWKDGVIDKENDLTHLAHNKVIGRNPKYEIPQEPFFKWKLSPIVVHKLNMDAAISTSKTWLGPQSLRVFASNDGVIDGASVTDMDVLPSGERWHNNDFAEWYEIVKYMLGRVKDQTAQGYFPKLIIECLPHNTEPGAWVPEFGGAIQAYHNHYDRWPEPYGKYPHIIPDPQPEPEPEPPTPQPEPIPAGCGVNAWYKHLKTWNFKAAYGHLIGKHNA